MKTKNTIFKRSLSILLTVLMCLSVCVLDFSGLILSADAGVTVSGSLPTVTFYVPETIYLNPSDAKTFRYYVDRNTDGTLVASASDTQGNIYFNCGSATAVTGLTCNGATVSLGATTSSSGTLNTTINSGSLASALTEGTTKQIEWAITFTVGGESHSAVAYTTIYSPFTSSVATEVARKRADTSVSVGTRAMANSTVWVTGIHSISDNGGSSRDATGSFNHNPLVETPDVATWTNGNNGTCSSVSTTSCSNDNNNPTTSNDLRYTSGGSGYTGYWTRQKDSGTSTILGKYNANITVDSSRYSNLNQVPNLTAGVDIQEQWDAKESTAGTVKILAGSTQLAYRGNDGNKKQNYQGWRFGAKINNAVSSVVIGAEVTARVATSNPQVNLIVSTVSKTDLRSNVTTCIGTYLPGYYTSGTWSAYETALKAAALVLGNPAASDSEISTANTNLNTAKGNLAMRTGTATVKHIGSNGKVFATETKAYNYGQTVSASANTITGYTYSSTASSVNLFNINDFYNTPKSQTGSNVSSVTLSNGVLSVTGTGADNYTSMPIWNGTASELDKYFIPVTAGATYTLSYTASGSTAQAYVFGVDAFGYSTSALAYSGNYGVGAQTISYTVPAGVSYVTFRFGNTSAVTTTFSNISFTKNGASATANSFSNVMAGTVEFTLTYNPITYTVAYNGNGATSGSTASQTFTYDEEKALATNGFSKTGYTFGGWVSPLVNDTATYSKDNTSGANYDNTKEYDIAAPFASGDVYVLECDAKATGTLSVFFYGGSNYLKVASVVNNYGVRSTGGDGNNTIPESSDYKHYKATFTLGSTGDGSVVKKLLFRAQIGANISVKNIKFGKVTSGNVKNLTATQGATYTYTANWVPNTYTVAYNGNGSTSGSTAASTHTYDLAKNLTANGFARQFTVTYNAAANGGTCTTANATATATFNGWATTASGTKAYNNSQSVINLTATNGATFNMFAKWTDGSVTLPSATKASDANYHYTFNGWYTAAENGTKIGDAGASYTPSAATTLYAQYTRTAHVYSSEETQTPTCTVPGITKYTCTCGYSYTDNTYPGVIAHTPVKIDAVNATCTTTGNNEYYQCSACHKYFTTIACTTETTPADQVTDALGHSMQTITAVTATCAATGNNQYYKCTRCNNYYKDEAGNTATTVADEITGKDANNHIGSTELRGYSAPSCAAAGYTGDTYCLGCGAKLETGSAISQLNHNFGDGWMTTVTATCSTKGEQKRVCTLCEYEETKEVAINPDNHEDIVDDVAVDATCTTSGLTAGKHCSKCGVVTVAQTTVNALGHDFKESAYTYNNNATCIADGTETAKCSRCAETNTRTKTGTKLGHDLENHPAQAATCTAVGWDAYQSCTRCDYTTKVEKPVLGHNLVHHAAQSVNCTQDGWEAYDTCSRCDYTTQVIQPALGHDWGSATCTEAAVCNRCHVSSGSAIGHDFTEQIIDSAHLKSEATCIAKAVYYYDCSRCSVNAKDYDTSKTFEYGTALGHNYDESISANVTVVAAKCTVDGSKTVKCSRCSDTKVTVIPATGHTEVTIPATPATCNDSGLTAGVKCSVCNTILTAQTVIPKLGHNFDESITENVTVVAAKCTVDGSKTVKCSRCTETNVTVLTAPGHNEVLIPAVPATCVTNGSTAGSKCSVCLEILVAPETISAFGHTASATPVEENIDAATCSKEGSCDKVIYCVTCGTELSRTHETIAKTSHKAVKIPAISAGCLTTGLTEGSKCAVCGEIIKAQETVDALGHDYRSRITVPVSCSQEGTTVYNCRRCGDSYTETVAKLDHIPGTEIKENNIAATCTTKGSYNKVIRCTMCNEILSTEHVETDYAPHTEVTIPAVEATCRETGLTEGKKCSRCGKITVEQQVIAKTEHNPLALEDTKPTCVQEGYTGKVVCSFCGLVLVEPAVTPATGHTWGEWVTVVEATYEKDGYKEKTCSVCGATERMVTSVGEKRLIKFYVFEGMYYIIDGKKYSSTTTGYTNLGDEIKFKVGMTNGNMFAGYTICADGVELTKDAEGYYTIPGGVNNVIVTATAIVEVPDKEGTGTGEGDSGSATGKKRMSFWEWLLSIFRKFAALFTGGK